MDHLTKNGELGHSEGTEPEKCAVVKAGEEEGLPGRRTLVKGRPKMSIDFSSTEVIGYVGEGYVRVCDTYQTGVDGETKDTDTREVTSCVSLV